MTTATNSRTQKVARQAAAKFSATVTERFGESVRAIVLYGSVGRGEGGEASDIDVLVLTDAAHPDRDEVVDIADSIDFENRYASYIVPLIMTPAKLQGLNAQNFPVARSILGEGVAIYDDGTFKRIREASSKSGGRNAN